MTPTNPTSATCAAARTLLIQLRDYLIVGSTGLLLLGGSAACDGAAEGIAPLLTIELTGNGTVYSRPSGTTCGTQGSDCGIVFRQGDEVVLAAEPDEGSVFRGWSGDCEGEQRQTIVRMGVEDKVCMATFGIWEPGDVIITSRRFELTIDGPGTVLIEPGNEECRSGATCGLTVEDASTFNLSVTYRAEAFLGWEGDCSGSAKTLVVVVDEDKACRAQFDPATYFPIRVQVEGEGQVESQPPGILCTGDGEGCEFAFREGTAVRLTAESFSGSYFSTWGHQCVDSSGTPLTWPVIDFTTASGLACSAAFSTGFNPDPNPDPGQSPNGWTCPSSFYNAGDGCDCGCGVVDPDCSSSSPSACEYCGGGCGSGSCPGNIGQPNATCTSTEASNWTCDELFYGAGDGCDCGCGVIDPDCDGSGSGACAFCSECGGCSGVNPTNNAQCL